MQSVEYFKTLSLLDQHVLEAKKQLAKQYAFLNNPYSIDDIITDGVNKIKITKINWSTRNFENLPCCVYKGQLLDKKDKPLPDKQDFQIWQPQIIGK